MSETNPAKGVVCSVLEANRERTAARLDAAHPGCRWVEIRADYLSAADVVELVATANRPVIVTSRRTADGGGWQRSETERRGLLLAALEAGADRVDVELDGPLRSLAEGPLAPRVILSHHDAPCEASSLSRLYRSMAASRAGYLKIVPRAQTVSELAAVEALLERSGRERRALACFASGRAGTLGRLLALSWGSWATYGSADVGQETASGQLPAAEMIDLYDVAGIGPATRRFALIGRSVLGSPSPAMHRAGYLDAGLDARYFPVELDSFDPHDPLFRIDGVGRFEGLAVTMPFKQRAFESCAETESVARTAGAVNTVRLSGRGWYGTNTDGPAALERIRLHLEPTGRRVAVVGAGGTAAAIGATLVAAGARVRLFNRDAERAADLSRRIGAEAAPFDALREARWDVLVQATPLGTQGERVVPAESLRGRLVLDVVYGRTTPLARDARARGLAVIDGLELLAAQAVLQFERLTGARASYDRFHRAARTWLASRGSILDDAPGEG